MKWLLAGYWQEDVKQQIYSSGVFVLRGRGVYTSPQRHGSLLWAVAGSHGGGQGTDAYQHPPAALFAHRQKGMLGVFAALAYSDLTPLNGLPALFDFECFKWFTKIY